MVEAVRAWAEGLEDLHGRISRRFVRAEPRRRALAYLKGLVGSSERKNGFYEKGILVKPTWRR